ncbi:hypothetical protein BDV29DRAFT_169217, partial [Aspergillus leporis]
MLALTLTLASLAPTFIVKISSYILGDTTSRSHPNPTFIAAVTGALAYYKIGAHVAGGSNHLMVQRTITFDVISLFRFKLLYSVLDRDI